MRQTEQIKSWVTDQGIIRRFKSGFDGRIYFLSVDSDELISARLAYHIITGWKYFSGSI